MEERWHISNKQSRSTSLQHFRQQGETIVRRPPLSPWPAFIGWKSIPPKIATNAPIIRDVSSNDVEAVRDAVGREPAQLRAVDLDGNTPLHIAARGGYDEMLKVLIDAGADVNAANRAGFTPLASALLSFEKNQPDIVRALIDAGARKDVQLADGRSLRQLAASLPNLSPEVIATCSAAKMALRAAGRDGRSRRFPMAAGERQVAVASVRHGVNHDIHNEVDSRNDGEKP